jgi:hypothetical protein
VLHAGSTPAISTCKSISTLLGAFCFLGGDEKREDSRFERELKGAGIILFWQSQRQNCRAGVAQNFRQEIYV